MSPPYSLALRFQLSALMFLVFTVLGAWMPVLPRHLQMLGFSPAQVAWVSATNATGALLAPFVWGQIADRWWPSERCISLCAAVSAALLFTLAELREPSTVLMTSMLLWFFLIPIFGLTPSLVFRLLPHPERQYGRIRLWGTVGWVAASMLLTAWLRLKASWGTSLADGGLADSLRWGGGFAGLLAFYALTLPHTPPAVAAASASTRGRWTQMVDAPLAAVRLCRHRSFAVYIACMFGVYVTFPFTMQLNPLLLASLEVGDDVLPLALTISQSSEVIMLAILPLLLDRWELKPTMIVGISVWTAALGLLALGWPLVLVLLALSSHGIFICCFIIAGQMFVNRQAGAHIRASAQTLLQLVAGLGMLAGHLSVGWIRQLTGDHFRTAYALAAVVSAALVVLFCTGFFANLGQTEAADAVVADSPMT